MSVCLSDTGMKRRVPKPHTVKLGGLRLKESLAKPYDDAGTGAITLKTRCRMTEVYKCGGSMY